MFVLRRRPHSLDIWPGFVDVLAAVLMAIIFVLMTFVVAHLYLTDALSDRDQTVTQMKQQLAILTQDLNQERLSKEEIQQIRTTLETQLAAQIQELQVVTQDLATEKVAKSQEVEKVATLSQQITELQEAIARLTTTLKIEEEKFKGKEGEVEALQRDLQGIQKENGLLKVKVDELTQKKSTFAELGQLRSDFLTKLVKVLGDRQDIRVVGDRFIFQSEVLFDRGSSDIGKEGQFQLDKLAIALKEIATKIPPAIHWVLRVDGHTDTVPINRPQFPSNWELSSARAISVVRYLISQGIDPKHLVAAGFGEFHPLNIQENPTNEKAIDLEKSMARNRRIEFRLDQR